MNRYEHKFYTEHRPLTGNKTIADLLLLKPQIFNINLDGKNFKYYFVDTNNGLIIYNKYGTEIGKFKNGSCMFSEELGLIKISNGKGKYGIFKLEGDKLILKLSFNFTSIELIDNKIIVVQDGKNMVFSSTTFKKIKS